MLDDEVEVADLEAVVVVEAGLDHAEKPILDQVLLVDLEAGLGEVRKRTLIPNLPTLNNNMETLEDLDHPTPNKIMDHLLEQELESKTGIVLTFLKATLSLCKVDLCITVLEEVDGLTLTQVVSTPTEMA